jgi:nucleotide-binding universal stress UspA family protein
MRSTILLAAALQRWAHYNVYALAARDVAATLARSTSKSLHILSVYAYPHNRTRGFPDATTAEYCEGLERHTDDIMARKIDDYVAPLQAQGIPITHLLRVGNPREVIVEVARTVQPDLLILGTHNKRGAFDIALSGTAQHICRHAPCMVVLVQPQK